MVWPLESDRDPYLCFMASLGSVLLWSFSLGFLRYGGFQNLSSGFQHSGSLEGRGAQSG